MTRPGVSAGDGTGSGTGADLWIRRFHPVADPARRLVCFPHAGGSAPFFFPLSQELSAPAGPGRRGVDVLAVQYPGRQDRLGEPAVTSIAGLAEGIATALRPWAGEPLTFFGHSMGAVVAFEVALRLRARGQDGPVRLIASGRRAPSRYRQRQDVHGRDDAGIVAELRQLAGTDPRLLGDEEILRMILPAIRADYTAVETYRSEPGAVLPCPVTVFTGDADPQVTLDEAQAWREHTIAGFDLRVFPGGHFYLAEDPGPVIAAIRAELAARAPAVPASAVPAPAVPEPPSQAASSRTSAR
ncbi:MULTISPECIES: thioesterase II family protein [Protofrankia]|uniref:Oleoyl-(Acyl-carrier-protein) hydrolase n=1 Tax=Candidatus Protofrankia datiscae TaxID=2716812 RepID=F8B3X2_9ACTN|nr:MULTISPECIES: alpha/beta fold hydrolase [Protofrankia]AEH09984.1 Oleoyl-(acyl-carrier-protein) hydrolase [Candidatus Protofrankia datiscae]